MKKTFLSLMLLTALICGCRKNEYVLDYSGVRPLIIIPNGNWPSKNIFAPQPADSLFGITQLRLFARVSYETVLDKPVSITFTEDPGVIESYNANWGTSYKPLPSTAYNIPSKTLTVPAGERQAFIPIEIFPDKFNGTDDYLIAYTISSANDQLVGANAKTIVFTIKGY